MIEHAKRILRPARVLWARLLMNRLNMARNSAKPERKLEIGSFNRLPEFETLNVVPGRLVDYVLDSTRALPFESGTFSIIYASHVIEHFPWYSVSAVLREWVRVLKPGGRLEIWVPDALKIFETVIEAEAGRISQTPDQWTRLNPTGDPYLWANGRLFYGANPGYPSWHTAMYTPRSLVQMLRSVGLVDVRVLTEAENTGPDLHGWINLGACGYAP